MERIKMKMVFYEHLARKPKKSNSFLLSKEKYYKLIQEVKVAKRGGKKKNRYYWLLKHYDVVTVSGKDQLIVPLANDQDQVRFYVVLEDIFDILYEIHESIGHGGRDRMRKEIQQRYKNITVFDIQTFLNLCQSCFQKRKIESKSLVVKPESSQLNSGCQVDLIDYHYKADGEYKFIMVYQDDLTKFVILKALKSKKIEEIAQHLLDIFLLFGAPTVLQSDNGREFCLKIIEYLKLLWPQLKIVLGKSNHNQFQGSVDRVNQDIEKILANWMLDNNCNNWSKGLGFTQFIKNKALLDGTKRSPFESMFGRSPKIGLTSSALPRDKIQKINTEEELENVWQESMLQNQKSLFHDDLSLPQKEISMQKMDVFETQKGLSQVGSDAECVIKEENIEEEEEDIP